ncbi:hypothetical protein [Demequina aurantiaca]|uniref:hypothetical protein n=1 Tax=Demequina aurantiaca TaxID=676200 RepID=UPI003D351186
MNEKLPPGPDVPPASSWHPHAPEWAPPTPGDSVPAPWATPEAPLTPGLQPPPAQSQQHAPATYAPVPATTPAPTFRSWQPGIIALRPLNFGDFLAAPFKAMRFNRGVVVGGPLLFTLAATALSVTALWLLFNDPQLGLMSTTTAPAGISPETVIVGILAFISVMLADVLSSTIVAPGVARAILGERITLRTAWSSVRSKFGHILLLYLVTAVALTAVIVLAAVPMIAAVAAGETTWIVLGMLLIFVVLVPAGFMVTLVTGLARPIIVLEQVGAIAALGRAWRLMRGRFWWSVLIVFVTTLLINIATSFLQTGGQIVAGLSALVAPNNGVVVAIAFFVIYGLAMVISFVVTYSYMGSVFTFMYTDMRMRHEGFDLDLARAAEARSRR